MSTSTPVPEKQAQSPEPMRKAVTAGTIGNFVEQFDFGIYGYLAPVMAPVFFPSQDPVVGVLSTYAILAIGTIIRPLGGMILGRWGDRFGRRSVLLWTIALMGLCTALIGVLPTYEQVGMLAPLLLLLMRMVQALISGGEYVGAIAFVVEWAHPKRRAYYTSFVSISVFVGILGGAGTSALTAVLFDDAALQSYGWRIPFLLALPLSLIGLWVRNRVGETPEFVKATADGAEVVKAPLTEAFKSQWREMLVFCGSSITLAIVSYTWVTYLPEFLSSNVGLSRAEALGSNAISVAVIIPLLPLAGALSDRIGRRPMLITGYLAALLLVPAAFAVAQLGTFTSAVIAQLIYVIPEFFLTGIVTVCVAEMFATKTRFSAGGVAYNSSFALFSGITPFVSALLVSTFGTIYAVWGYLAVAAVISLVVVIKWMEESYRLDLTTGKPMVQQ
ncbi:MFS transporter, MHS family, proline/betaine transporter [Saccharopolyspora flava]|uniref:MFS transporter, MHS family, proline/betaine transporter n=1 Tax=Saccharopolyspora flava TaxID=95161 RepID=A0A1I6S303_9PSEU|nr:MFS transporter, MHS family, proline/betaine transporter [Saccharopolyspora flava]